MKPHTHIIALLFLLFVPLLRADDVDVTWDHDGAADPDMPITFRVEIAPITKPDAWRVSAEGITTKVHTITGLLPGAWNARVFAVAGGVKSLPSNILKIEIAPQPPRQPVKVAIQSSTDMKTWTEVASTYTGTGGKRMYFRAAITPFQ